MIDTAMVLAAGRGERLRPITDNCPKPLVQIKGKALLDHVLDKLQLLGLKRIVVNACYLKDQIFDHIQGYKSSVPIDVSEEDICLETGGGVLNALPLLGPSPFFVINADIYWEGTELIDTLKDAWDNKKMEALLGLIPRKNAIGHDKEKGDFSLCRTGRIIKGDSHIFSGVQILDPKVFSSYADGCFSLREVYSATMSRKHLYGVSCPVPWYHLGTPEALAKARQLLDL